MIFPLPHQENGQEAIQEINFSHTDFFMVSKIQVGPISGSQLTQNTEYRQNHHDNAINMVQISNVIHHLNSTLDRSSITRVGDNIMTVNDLKLTNPVSNG